MSAKVSRTVLKTSRGSDPPAEFGGVAYPARKGADFPRVLADANRGQTDLRKQGRSVGVQDVCRLPTVPCVGSHAVTSRWSARPRRGTACFYQCVGQCLSCVRRKAPAQFLGEGTAVTWFPYPTHKATRWVTDGLHANQIPHI